MGTVGLTYRFYKLATHVCRQLERADRAKLNVELFSAIA